MGMEYAEEPFNMGMFFLPKASFKMGTFSDPQYIFILESSPGEQLRAGTLGAAHYRSVSPPPFRSTSRPD